MALSPGIPTSFVPKQPVQPAANRPMKSGNNIFLTASIVIITVMVLMSAGVFGYNLYLSKQLESKTAQLTTAQNKVDQNVIEEFVRLRDRLDSGESLLTNHVVLSQFFTFLEGVTIQNVRFNTMKLLVANDHSATIEFTGTAKNFNSLAAESNAIASEKMIKRAIFSNISVDEKKLVTFKLTAVLDQRLVVAGGTDQQGQGSAPSLLQSSQSATNQQQAVPASSTSVTTTP